MTSLHILGGGPAGLAAAWYANRLGIEARVYEAGPETGGNCRTLRRGEFLFDTGAHRLHDKDPDFTREIRALLGEALLEVDAPSRIALGGRLLRFPLSPLDLLRRLDARRVARIAGELALRRKPPSSPASFEELAVGRYGKTLSGLFLLGYTRKLWGRAPGDLSPAVAGGRLAGLSAATLLREALARPFRRRRARARHLDGSFLYPRLGIGALFAALRERLPAGSVRVNSRVTRIRHDGASLLGITLNGEEEIATPRVVSTLPLPAFLAALDPPPPSGILALAAGIAYRHLVLCVLFLDLDRFSENASLYFPEAEVPFTRLYEPRNRSPHMAPPGKTCVVLELPCDPGDAVWRADDDALVARVLPHLRAVRPLPEGCVFDAAVYRIPHAYPVLERGVEARVETLMAWCARFDNLRFAGRNALFRYAHIHDMFRAGREAVQDSAA
jgi:protoporphyrinogen oxidase